ncbi:MAG: SprT family zinc-dependent metalloprotease [Thermoleophilia bacterium]
MPVADVLGTSVAYRMIRTRRARRITIRVTPDGVVVTGPRGVRQGAAVAALRHHGAWVLDALAREAARAPLAPLPGQHWPLLDEDLLLTAHAGSRVRRDGPLLLVPHGGDPRAALERWYRTAARAHFGLLLPDWETRVGVRSAGLRIAGQRGRWGSASASGTISLNWRLMMAPSAVAEYVAVHELCHLVHMDHSPAFWALVQHHLPGHAAQRAWLREHGADLLDRLRAPGAVQAVR